MVKRKTAKRDYVEIIEAAGPVSVIKVREAMTTLASDLRTGHVGPMYAARVIDKMVVALHRKKPISVAPKRIRPLTDEVKAEIRQAHVTNPRASQLELANLFNTNPGRISEALNEGRP